MGKPVLIALFPADKEAFAWGGDGSQVPVPVGINMGGKWQKSIYPATGVVYGGKWGDKTPFTAIYKAYTPFSITTLFWAL